MQPLIIPINDRDGKPIPQEGDPTTQFYSANGTLLATGYMRVVIGRRGAYIEFAPEHMAMQNLHVPAAQEWRYQSEMAYYIEHRSRDAANVKVYEQRRPVGYADYKVGLFYIAPADVIIKT
jgi:hypothetical protein